MVAEAISLRLVENRVHILIAASDALWTRDESRAQALARQAMDQVAAHIDSSADATLHTCVTPS
jgi:hypothetical protein